MLSYAGCVLILSLLSGTFAQDAISPQKRETAISRMGGIGLEEVVLFLIGLGVAAALGLAIVIGPLFAIFFTTFGNQNGNNGGSTTGAPFTVASGKRNYIFGDGATKGVLTDTILQGLQMLDVALKKYQNL